MKVYTRLTGRWNDLRNEYETLEELHFEYEGPVVQLCGATPQQTSAQEQQASFATQVQQQASQVFGSDSSVFSDLMSTFAPTIAAGPNQEGFSAGEKSNLDSSAITETGQAYKNAKEAVGEAESAQGGGNTSGVTSGANVGTDLSVANSAAAQTSGELNQIDEADYQTGRANYDAATSGLLNATNSFNSATSSDNAETSAGTASANTANQIASENNSWVQSVTGALGGIAGAVTTGGMSNLGKGVGFFGQNAQAPSD